MVNFFDKSKNQAQKKMIAELGAAIVENGMTIGLGSGSTMAYFVEAVAKRINEEKLTVQFVPASKTIEQKALDYGLKLISIECVQEIDYAFDGADWIINKETLIKGGGGSLFREKKILLNSVQRFILADESKFIDRLSDSIIPIEIVPFGYTKTIHSIREVGGECYLRKRMDEEKYLTDNYNYIVDARFSGIGNWGFIHEQLKRIQGVVDTGIFCNMEFQIITLEKE
ncbi:ribose 5-phosphate isomerase A [Ureibacillus sinduriensis]|nr:ribose 5-phosphate isomerase A [Ureibacillus sinduriensis]